MTRIRTHRTDKYFSLSNASAQDPNLSWEAIGFLSYCLSMPPDWEFHPKQIWKMNKSGREKTYKIFNELIENYRCIRIRKPNPKARNLPGEISYEIFDDIDDCKKAIEELEKTDNFIDHGGNLKKCFRQTAFEDTEATDTVKPYNTKEIEATKETFLEKQQQQKPQKSRIPEAMSSVVVVLSHEERIAKEKLLKDYNVSEDMAKEFADMTYLRIKNAVEALNQAEAKGNVTNRIGYLREAIRKGWCVTETKSDKRKKEEEKLEGMNSLREKVKQECKNLEDQYKDKFARKREFTVRDCLTLISEKGNVFKDFLEKDCLSSLKAFINIYFKPNYMENT